MTLVYTVTDPAGDAVAFRYPNLIKDGRIDSFKDDVPQNPGVYTREGFDAVIEYTGGSEDEFHYKTSAGGLYVFESFVYGENDNLGAHFWYRLKSISDANNNTLTVSYKDTSENENDSVRVHSVEDTLGNIIEFNYDDLRNAYLLTSIYDVSGDRTVEYAYEKTVLGIPCEGDGPISGGGQTPPPGGFVVIDDVSMQPCIEVCPSSYLLKEVLLPAVESTVSGNYQGLPQEHQDRYDRRAWKYGYVGVKYSGLPSRDVLALRLKWILDPTGTDYLVNTYDFQFSENSPFPYRPVVESQSTPSGDYHFEYSDLSGQSPETFIVTVSTKRGQIIELEYEDRSDLREDAEGTFYCFDSGSMDVSWLAGRGRVAYHLVERRHLTGFADKDADPYVIAIAQVRSGDPSEFGTAYVRNDDWKITESTLADGTKIDLTYFPVPDSQQSTAEEELEYAFKKTLVVKNDITDAGSTTITEEWEYDHAFGGCCGGSGYPTKYTDGNGYVAEYHYDDAGNLIWARRGIVGSAAPLSDEFFGYNTHGQMTVHVHPPHESPDGLKRRVDTFEYGSSGTANGRMTRMTVAAGLADSATGVTGLAEALSYIDGIESNMDAGEALEHTYEYDAVGNIVKVTDPDGHYKTIIWNQADQIVREQWYDGGTNDLLTQRDYFYEVRGNPVRIDEIDFEEVSGSRSNARTADDWAVTLHEYDEENNLVRTAQRLEPTLLATGVPSADQHGAYVGLGSLSSDYWAVTEYVYDENKSIVAIRYPEAVAEFQLDNGVVMEYDERDLLYRRFQGSTNIDDPTDLSESSNAPLPLVYQADYDEMGRLSRSVVDPDGSSPRETIIVYDGFGRMINQIDPMGNTTQFVYDNNHNLLDTIVDGELVDVTGDTGNDLLSWTRTAYDALNRPTDRYVAVFDPEDPPAGEPTDWQWSHTVYNADSSVRSVTVPAGADPASEFGGTGDTSTTAYLYDAAGRLAEIEDELGNTTEYIYDSDHLVAVRSVEVSGLSAGDETYETRYEYDGLHRRTAVVEGVYGSGTLTGPQNRTEMEYDSRSNLIAVSDPRGTRTEHLYDGLSRRYLTTVDPGGLSIETAVLYDLSSRVVELTDDNGHSTAYHYDSLGREVKRVYADGSEHTVGYDSAGNVATTIDARGMRIDSIYDLNNRLSSREMTRPIGGGVGGTWSESYKHDGLGRVVKANNDFASVARAYDSRGLVLAESLNADKAASPAFPSSSARVVSCEYDLAGNMTLCIYPSGREVHRAYDGLNRVAGVFDDAGHTAPLAGYDYIGPGRVERRTTGAGGGLVETDYLYTGFEGDSASDHGFRHAAKIEHRLGSTGAMLEGRSFTWDEAGSKTSHADLRTSGAGRREREFDYDAANRLIESAATYPGNSSLNGTVGYTLDGVHNRIGVSLTGADQSGASVGGYELVSDEENGVFHAELNQYTVTPRLDGGSFDFEYAYDANGNLTLIMEYPRTADMDGNYVVDGGDLQMFLTAFQEEDPIADLNGDGVFDQADMTLFTDAYTNAPAGGFYYASFKYDERNQLVGFEARRGGTLLKKVSFRYDAFNRRVASFADTDGDASDDVVTYSVYGGQAAWQLLGEYDGADDTANLLRSYVYGLYIDEVVSMRDHASDDDYFYHQDDLFSVYALTDGDGVVVERYDYGDYGQVSIMEADGTPRAESQYDNRHAFTGRLLVPGLTLDDGSQILEYRHRYLHTASGRFVQRDPLGYWDSPNLYSYVSNNSLSMLDPLGLLGDYFDPSPLDIDDYAWPEDLESLDAGPNWGQICDFLRRKIEEIRKQIQNRERQLQKDILKLPECTPNDWRKPSESRRGHRNIISDLRKILDVYTDSFIANGCGGGPRPPSPIRPSRQPSPGFRLKPKEEPRQIPHLVPIPKPRWPIRLPSPGKIPGSVPIPIPRVVPGFILPDVWSNPNPYRGPTMA